MQTRSEHELQGHIMVGFCANFSNSHTETILFTVKALFNVEIQ